MKVVVMPGPVVCYDCGHVMKPDMVTNPKEFVMGVTCMTPECVNHEKMHIFPLISIEVQALPETPRIIIQ